MNRGAWRTLAAAVLALAPCAPAASAEALSIDGEVYARSTAPLLPPNIDRLWMLNITRLAPDGAPVKQGEVVLAFDGSDLLQRLTEKNSKLAEKQRELDTLLLDLAERERSAELETAEARAELEKARRKTEQPQELIAGIAYRKLVIAREQAEKRMVLAERNQALSAEQRRQERRLLDAEIAQLEDEVAQTQASLAALEVKAPRDGLMLHKSTWNGEKFDVGSQVWRGQAVAEIPDTGTLAVRADLPERDLTRVRVGMPVRVVEGGAGVAVRGEIVSIGRAVRSKSRVQPVPVLDLEIELDNAAARLKPGQAVRVEIEVAEQRS